MCNTVFRRDWSVGLNLLCACLCMNITWVWVKDWLSVCNSVMWGLLWVILLVGLTVLVLSSVWLTDCATCFTDTSIISPWYVSKSEFECGKIELTDAGVLWFLGVRRQILLTFEFWIAPCTCIWPEGGCLMEGLCNSSLTLLPLSSLHLMKKDQVPLCPIILVL